MILSFESRRLSVAIDGRRVTDIHMTVDVPTIDKGVGIIRDELPVVSGPSPKISAGISMDLPSARGRLAIICGELTPYRVHFHKRLVREIPELELCTVLARDSAWSAWKLQDVSEINPVYLAEGQLPRSKGRIGYLRVQARQASDTVRWLESHRPAAVVVNGYDELSRLRAIRWCQRNGVPALLWGDSNIHGDNGTGLRQAAKKIAVSEVVRRCSAILVCGTLGEAYFRRYGARTERIFYVPYEPDYDGLRVDAAVLDEARAKFDLDSGRFRFVVSSRLVPHKRVDLAIDAFSTVAEQRPLWDLTILGDGPERAALERRVPAHLRTRVRFAGFIGQQRLVSAVYGLSHVLVHIPQSEPWAVVINEAAAAGLAIVSTDVVGASAELVRDGVNGRSVPVNHLAELVAAMLDVSLPENMERMRAGSADVLSDWRRRGDPVQGLRKALRYLGVLR
jgi:glycosyltransferase involved in cell wall biosynthesis